MTDKQSEMSIDEVLSSIKQMVVDKDPPVLELTDMIAADGNIVSVKKGCELPENRDMKAFLRLAQENSEDEMSEADRCVRESSPVREKKVLNGNSNSMLAGIVREIATPIVKNWLDINLQRIVREVVNKEIRSLISNEDN